MEKQSVLKELKLTRVISSDMLSVLGMPFEVFLQYAKMNEKSKQKIINKAIKKLDPDFCDAFIASADYYDKPMSDDMIDYMNDNDNGFINEYIFNNQLDLKKN